MLGYEIECGVIRPDPDRLQGLRNIKMPMNKKEMSRVMGLLSYFSKWIRNFSAKVEPLVNTGFPMSKRAKGVVK